MSRHEPAEAFALEVVEGIRNLDDRFTPEGFAALATDGFDGVAAVLLASRVPRKRTVRAWFWGFELRPAGWEMLFDHNDPWWDEPFARPSGGSPLSGHTSVRGDGTCDGTPVMCFAGVATTQVHDAVVTSVTGSRPVAITPSTGAFVVIVPGERIELALRDADGQVVDRYASTAPPAEM